MARPTEELRRLGLCVQCKKAPRVHPKASCLSCLERSRTRSRTLKRKQFAERRLLGLCVKCKAPLCSKRAHCKECLEKRKLRTRMLMANGLCLRCRVPLTNGLKYCSGCLVLYGERHKAFAERLKREVFNRYGGCRCECCGESHDAFLTIDHIHGNGTRHRNENTGGKGGESFYRWLKKEGFPDGYRVLCFNCNYANWKLGTCPHKLTP